MKKPRLRRQALGGIQDQSVFGEVTIFEQGNC